ncbi:MAG TPA: kelch repeat-containing protein, partial [Elusimicrobiales bacterium]|nr:kelch repeat-containing protein [Elusimicrobiales bacterium]
EARSHPGFAFDESRGEALLFGGRAEDGNALGDTWLWSAGVWTRKTPVGAPSARYGHALVWAGGRFLLFGGNGLSDTWTYDIGSDTWTLVRPPESPAARDFPVMAYDPDLGRAVLFGGGTDNGTWIYDVAAGTWSALAPSPSPPDRHAAAMAYDRAGRKMILFGRRTPAGALLDDTWAFDVSAGTWTDLAPASRPAARWQSAAAYDTLNGGVFLYGGFTTSYSGDLWYYNSAGNKWSQHYELDPDESAGRYAHGLVYDTPGKRAVIFGGVQDTAVKSVWLFHFRSSAVWTSAAMDPWAGYSSTTALTWDSLSASFGELPAGAGALLQLASSRDGVSYGLFRGPDGSTDTFYTAGAPAAIWPGHGGDRYMKLRAFLFSTDPPGRPKISALRAGYDRAPFSPAPASPADGSRINDPAPLFSCAPTSDPDGIFTDWPLLYHIQASTDPDFSVSAFSIENVPVEGSYASTAPAAALPEGLWYWRARARDPAGLYGNWSPAFSVLLDTHTPPSPVTVMSAARGPAVNSAAVTWTFPGDDKGRVDGGTWRIRYSSSGALLTEEEWAAAVPESSGVFSAAPGESLSVSLPGLPGGTTFFFALRTEDELGNLSELSAVSPSMTTDSSPTVTLIAPNGGGFHVRETTISWTMSDPDEDALICSLYLSSDSGASYPILIEAGLPAGATSYLWDSAREPNGSFYRVKVVAEDARGLRASDASDSDFRAENTNSMPSVSFVSVPGAGEEVSGALTVSWSVSDPNDADTHVCSVYLSGNSGSSYSLLAAGLPCADYELDTRSLSNSSSYRLRVVALDSGTPALSGAAESPVFSVVNTLPPAAFELIKPLEDTLPSVFDLRFSWSAAADPEGGPVTYSLRYSTTPGPDGGTSVGGLSIT